MKLKGPQGTRWRRVEELSKAGRQNNKKRKER